MRLVGDNQTGIWRQRQLTIRKSIKCIHRHIGRNAGLQINDDFNVFGGLVNDFFDFDFTFFGGFQDGFYEVACRRAKRYFLDQKLFFIRRNGNSCAHPYFSTAFSSVVIGHIYHPCGLEIGQNIGWASFQHINTRFNEFDKIMRQNLGGQAHRDSFNALCQQQRELHRQRHRLAFAPIVSHLPVRGLIVKRYFQGKWRQTCLNITWCGGRVARANVAPVALTVNQ